MTRSLTAGMQTAVAAERGDVVRFLELDFSGGTLRWTTASQDIDWNGQTWTAVGGVLQLGGTQEGSDLRGEGIPAVLSGVDGVVLSTVLQNGFRGHEVVVWRAHISDGDVVADPIEEFRGYQNAAYRIRDRPGAEGLGGGTITVETRWVSRLAKLHAVNAVRASLHSHRDMLRRAGLVGAALDDSIMRFLPGLAGKQIRWGQDTPARYGGGGTGGRGGVSEEEWGDLY